MVEVLNGIIDVLNKKEGEKFKQFLNNFPQVKSWYLISDYCLDDSNKCNDVFTFSLLYNIDKIDSIKDYVRQYAPTDLKKTKNVSTGIIDFINSSAIYHFSIIIPREEKLLAKLCDKNRFVDIVDKIFEMVTNSRDAHPHLADFYTDMLQRMKLLKTDMLKTSFNEKLLRKIFITSFLGSSIIQMLQKYSKPTHVAWISDRDAIVDTYKGFAFDNMYFWYEILAMRSDFPITPLQIIYVEPEKVGENFYDELIRIPDFIAGTLASVDSVIKDNNIDIHDKHKIILQQSLTNTQNHATLRIHRTDTHLSVYNFKWVHNEKTY